MDQFIKTLNELQLESEKWSKLNKQYPDVTFKRNEKFLQTFHPDDFLTDMISNLQQMNSSYENKITVRNQVDEFLKQVNDIQSSLPNNNGSCKVDKYGYINITNSSVAMTFYVFQYNQQENKFKQLRLFQRSNLGRCNTWIDNWDKKYYEQFDDGVPHDEKEPFKFYDVDQILTSEEILTNLKKDFR